ncbi:MAG TPA: hypothetical protein O0X66_06040 [Methanocorpusculum sp.]|nr:hypothetical protein [Methanocorpusculum sp.]
MPRFFSVTLIIIILLLVFSSGCVSQTGSVNTTERTVLPLDPEQI